MGDRFQRFTRRAALKGGLLATGAAAAGVSAFAWLLEACSSSGAGGGYGYGWDPYGYGWRSGSARQRWAARFGPRRIAGG
jgi:hypothetical protein